MQEVEIRFEQDPTLDHIEVVLRSAERNAAIEALIRQLEQVMPQKLTVLDHEGIPSVINEDEIITVSSDGKQVRIITEKGLFTAKQTLQNVEEYLSSHLFLRISRFELINLNRVSKYDFTIAGTLRIEFEGGMEAWASRRYIPKIREKLSGEGGYLC
ncbi:MAG: LytTR family transcriptional regulator DNA-binding domain-containing protein [Eubacterium sp.]|nr:LytTR family transcriptional regulator DNA-binding domain-containing protein [Eubacterium sp.]